MTQETITPLQIAEKFAAILREWLTPDEWAEMLERNKGYSPEICASHDFCDANMAMLEAMQANGLEPLPDNGPMPDDMAALWNQAFDIARRHMLTGE